MSLTGHNMRRALAAKAAPEPPAEAAEPAAEVAATEAPAEAEDAPKRRGRPAKTEE